MNNKNEVTLFTNLQIWYHKHIIHFMMIFIITGTPLVSHYFTWLAYIFGVPFSVFTGVTAYQETVVVGIEVCRLIHRVSAILWLLISIPFILNMLPKIFKWDMTPKRRKGESWSNYLSEGFKDVTRVYIDFKYPKHMGKYNIAQMITAWGVIFICIAMAITGLILVGRGYVNPSLASFAKIVHFGGYVAMILFLIIHVYLAVHPINSAGYNAMFKTGKDSVSHAKKKHPGMMS